MDRSSISYRVIVCRYIGIRSRIGFGNSLVEDKQIFCNSNLQCHLRVDKSRDTFDVGNTGTKIPNLEIFVLRFMK